MLNQINDFLYQTNKKTYIFIFNKIFINKYLIDTIKTNDLLKFSIFFQCT